MKILILLFCIFLTGNLFGQKFTVKYDPNLITEKKIISDTIYWSYTDSLNNEHMDLYPQNSGVIFIENKDSIILGSTSAKIVKDTLIISISKISYGQQIKVLIRLTNNLNCNGELLYWTAMMGQESTLKINDCNLILSQNNFKKGQNLMGRLNLNFTGIIPDELDIIEVEANSDNTKVYSEKSGEIFGEFNIIIE